MKVKKALWLLLKIVIGIVLFLLLWICAAFLLPKIKVNKDFTSCSDKNGITMYLRSNGMHTDVVFPVQTTERDWTDLFPIQLYEGVDSSFQYIAVGWGDKGFYLNTPTWAELKVSTALKATVGISGSAMHITYLSKPPFIDGKEGMQLCISPEQYRKLLSYIDEAFVRNTEGNIIMIQHPDYDTNDNYYEAKGRYNLFKTCNVWTSKCLKSAGIQNGFWTPTAEGVMSSAPGK